MTRCGVAKVAIPPAASDLRERAAAIYNEACVMPRHLVLQVIEEHLAAIRDEAIEPWRAKLAEQCGHTLAARKLLAEAEERLHGQVAARH